jgi:hypothetical protein
MTSIAISTFSDTHANKKGAALCLRCPNATLISLCGDSQAAGIDGWFAFLNDYDMSREQELGFRCQRYRKGRRGKKIGDQWNRI